MQREHPIGLFDSGVGGTSIWKEINALLPYENTVYLADSKNAPYGNKTKDEIIALSIKNTEYLLEQNCKIIVVACNTATTNTISILRNKYDVPFIGIEPAIKPAALQTKTGAIGILATKGTLSSALFHKTSQVFTQDISVIEIIGEGLVSIIEAGDFENPLLDQLLQKYIQPMLDAQIDYLVLGCSHYPYLIPKLRTMLPEYITIIDSGIATARQTKKVLQKNASEIVSTYPPSLQFYSNTHTKTLALLLQEHTQALTIKTLDF